MNDLSQLELEIISDPTLSYVSYQNHVPAIRAIRITNASSKFLDAVEVAVSVDPPAAAPLTVRFARLEPGETRRISPVDLKCSHENLASRTEMERGRFEVVARQGDAVLGKATADVELLAYDQWAGLRALPELLAAFSMPNDPAVDRILGVAGDMLRRSGKAFSGYEAKSREHVLIQIAAIYAAVSAERLSYAMPPAGFVGKGQRIRSPERIIDGRIATCLDTAMLLSSCLEQTGLNPVVLLSKDHAWVGCWLVPRRSATPAVTDIQDVRKRVKSGELLALETTLVTGDPAGTFTAACERGAQQLEGDDGAFVAIDVGGARDRRVLPIPSRTAAATQEPPPAPTEPQLPQLPGLPPAPPDDGDLETAPNTPQGRIQTWENKLLDLSLRNRLLNFRETKGCVALVVPDAGALEDELSAGTEFRFEADPGLMEGPDPRDANVHDTRTGKDARLEHARSLFERKRLLARLNDKDLEGRLLDIFLNARTSLEEGGANTLFIAMGFLLWSEDRGSKTHRAPIVLVPVSLKRQSVRGGYSLTRHDDEAIVNPTLLQMLKRDNDLQIEGLGSLVTDDSGIDVAGAWQAFRKAVADVKGWEVREDVFLGNFSFTKYLMWKDLHSRLADLKKSRVVAHLVDTPHLPYPGAAGLGRSKGLDREFTPQQLLAPLICDSSQLQAIADAAEGRDLVMDGPPGTGKSQTISNLVAHFLGHGKTVLFVSEKIAALNVVHTRLNALGLGPFCLELHSAKAHKAEVIRQLINTLDFARAGPEAWEQEAQKLQARRGELNDFAELLHREGRNGLTVYEAAGTKVLHAGWIPAPFGWPDPETHDRAALDDLRELMSRIRALSEHFSNLQAQGLEGVGHPDWSPGWEDQFLEAVDALRGSIAVLQERSTTVQKLAGADLSGASQKTLARFSALADVLLRAASSPAAFVAKALDPDVRRALKTFAKTGRSRDAAWRELMGFKPSAAGLRGAELQAQWAAAGATWWPKSIFARKKVQSTLALHRADGSRPSRESVADLLEGITKLNGFDDVLAAQTPAATSLLGSVFAGLETRWADVERLAAWGDELEVGCDGFARADLEAIQGVRDRVHELLAKHQRLLAPNEVVGKALAAYRQAHAAFIAALAIAEELARGPHPLCGAEDESDAIGRALSTTATWITRRKVLKPWCLWQALRQEAIAKGVESVVHLLDTGSVSVTQVEDFFAYSYRSWWLKRMIDREPLLRAFTGTDHERRIKEFRDADARFQNLTCKYILARAAQRIPNANAPVGQDSELGRLRREGNRQRGHMPIRQLLQQLPTLLTRLKPCMLMSPLSIAQYLDASQQQFDVVIFDEASQIPVWDAIGAIARGKQLIVAGDPKQLPPTTFFQKAAGESDETDDPDAVEDLESMLDECLAAGLPRRQLLWHYRSRHESLITFSNHTYYAGGLITFPSPVTSDRAVSLHSVKGTYDRAGSRTNRAEADAVVGAIESHYLDPAMRTKSVGVVTFNVAQQQLIQRLVDERRRGNEALDRALVDTAQREPLFIKNLENVQGDERDLILFSITYGPDAAGVVSMNFGPLNQDGGHRRLNVAITRAREAVRIYSTLAPEDIDPARSRAAGVLDLKTYLEFARKGAAAILERSTPTGLEPESPFEVAVITRLREKGWIVHPQVGCSSYRIDLAVVNPEAPGQYLMGVECDGRTYHSSATARDRDRLRQMVLEGLGWRLHRIWSTDWWLDDARETQRLHEVLEARLRDVRNPQKSPSAAPEAPAAIVTPRDPQRGQAASPSAPANGSTGAAAYSGPSPYKPVLLSSTDEDFSGPRSDGLIRTHLGLVINGEGPISQEVLFKRVIRAWGIARLGNRITERLERLTPGQHQRTNNHGVFFWPAGTTPKTWSGMRAHEEWAEKTCRHIEEVCTYEMANLAAWVLSNNGRISAMDMARKVCELVGMARVSEEASKRALLGVRELCDSGRAVWDGDYVTPATAKA